MENAIRETQRRREIQMRYNEEHGIVPKTIHKDVRDVIEISKQEPSASGKRSKKKMTPEETKAEVKRLTEEMKNAASMLEFEYAAQIRDKIAQITGKRPS